MQRKYKIASVIIALSCLSGCAGNAGNVVVPNAPTPMAVSDKTVGIEPVDLINYDFQEAIDNASVKIFKEATREELEKGNNVVMSPISLLFAMGMAANGAKNNTYTQIADTLYGGLDIDTVNSNLAYLFQRIDNVTDITFNSANSVWFSEKLADGVNSATLKPKQEFIDKVVALFKADVYKEQFTEQTVNSVNDWISNRTQGHIPKMLDKLDKAEDAALLINALYFDAKWQTEYEDDDIKNNSTFTNNKGIKENNKVLLHSDEDGHYLANDIVDAAYKYYKGRNYALLVMLPKDTTASLIDVIEQLSNNNVFKSLWYSGNVAFDIGKAGAFGNWQYEDATVDLYIPEFETESYYTDIKSVLQNMGIKDAFVDGHTADFYDMCSVISDKTGEETSVYIKDILQKAKIEVNREGTKASAATVIMMTGDLAAAAAVSSTPPHKVIKCDRPFVYAIVDCKNGVPIFMGAVNTLN